MNLVLGFGSTEAEFESDLEAAFETFVVAKYSALKPDYFTDEFVKMVEDWARDHAKPFMAASKEYAKAATFPDRYSYFYPSIAQSASDIVLIVTFHHINRRHAFSPDGWGLMQNKRLFHVSTTDMIQPRSDT